MLAFLKALRPKILKANLMNFILPISNIQEFKCAMKTSRHSNRSYCFIACLHAHAGYCFKKIPKNPGEISYTFWCALWKISLKNWKIWKILVRSLGGLHDIN